MERISIKSCEQGRIISQQTHRTGKEIVVHTKVAAACMYHALCGLRGLKIINEQEVIGKCPVEKHLDSFAYCKAEIKYSTK